MDEQDRDVVIPVIREELHADTAPVVTGGVRVTKRVDSHDEIIEQELRKSRVEVRRVRTDRVVDGPQPVQRIGNELIVPVVSEVLRVEKQWVVTEEIHITQIEESEAVQNKVTLSGEHAEIERVDEAGNVVTSAPGDEEEESRPQPVRPVSILQRGSAADTKRLGRSRSILKSRRRDE